MPIYKNHFSIQLILAFAIIVIATVISTFAIYLTNHAMMRVQEANRAAEMTRLEGVFDGVYSAWTDRGSQLAGTIAAMKDIASSAEHGERGKALAAIHRMRGPIEMEGGATGICILNSKLQRIAEDYQVGRLDFLNGEIPNEPKVKLDCNTAPKPLEKNCFQYLAVPILGEKGSKVGVVVLRFEIWDLLAIFEKISSMKLRVAPVEALKAENLEMLRPKTTAIPLGYAIAIPRSRSREDDIVKKFYLDLMAIFGIGTLLLVIAVWSIAAFELRVLNRLAQKVQILLFGEGDRFRLEMEKVRKGWSSDLKSLADLFIDLSYKFDEHQTDKEAMVRQEIMLEVADKAQKDADIFIERVARANEEERHNLARDLHDEIGQWQTAIRLHLELLRSDYAEGADMQGKLGHIDMMISSLDSMHRALHRMMANLHPESLEVLGLGAALDDLAATWKVSGLKAEIMSTIDHDALNGLDKTSAAIVYRVVQEGFTNAVKYAEASLIQMSVTVSGQCEDKQRPTINICIRDNGNGFDVTAPPSGKGLNGMQDRVRCVGGACSITSTLGHGTTIEISFKAISVGIPKEKGLH